MSSAPNPSFPIGQQLVRKGLITQEELAEALGFQKAVGGRLGKVLQKIGSLDEESFARFLAQEYETPYLPWEEVVVDRTLIRSVPPDLMRERLFFPLTRAALRTVLAMSDPTDCEVLDRFSRDGARTVDIVVVSARTVERVLHDVFDPPAQREEPVVTAKGMAGGHQMASLIKGTPPKELTGALIRALVQKRVISVDDLLEQLG